MNEHSGRGWREPFAHFDPDTSSWRTSQPSLLPESFSEPSPTWPRSGTWDLGAAYERPVSGHHMGGTGASSLLPTPNDHEVRREPHRPDSTDTLSRALAETLLPTPRATDGTKGGPNQRGSSGDLIPPSAVVQLLPTPSVADVTGGHKHRSGDRSGELLLPGVVLTLLPTPTAMDSKASGGSSPSDVTLTDAVVRASLGARTNPRHRDAHLSE